MPAPPQIPDMDPMAVFTIEQQFRVQAVLDHVRRAPLAGDHRVMAEVPPEIIGQILRSTIYLPLAKYIEGRVVQQEDAARSFAFGRSQSANVYTLWTAVDCVQPGIMGAC